ncbi:hypothetical protein CBL_13790 [Carabus blaptoides fortunei]
MCFECSRLVQKVPIDISRNLNLKALVRPLALSVKCDPTELTKDLIDFWIITTEKECNTASGKADVAKTKTATSKTHGVCCGTQTQKPELKVTSIWKFKENS